jgi:hypothetical protein
VRGGVVRAADLCDAPEKQFKLCLI